MILAENFAASSGVLATVFGISCLSALLLTPLVRKLARLAGVIDMPEARRIHSVPTPRWGGLAVYAALLLSLGSAAAAFSPLLRERLHEHELQWIAALVAITCLLIVGLADDRHSVRPLVKLSFEVVCAALVAAAGIQFHSVFGIHLGYFSPPLTVFWIVAVVNAFNMVDGVDGLAGGLAVIMCIALVYVSIRAGEMGNAIVMIAACGALLGFLRYNFNPASIFLGDSGTMFMGFLIAIAAVRAGAKSSQVVTIAAPTLALAVPLAELFVTMLRRILRAIKVEQDSADSTAYRFRAVGRAAIFSADRDHIHHRLLARGLSQRKAALLMYGVCIAINIAALAVVAENQKYRGLVLIIIAAGAIGIHALGYKELQLLRNGLLLPLFKLRIFRRHGPAQMAVDFSFGVISLAAARCVHHVDMPGYAASMWWSLVALGLVAALQTLMLSLGGMYRRREDFRATEDALIIVRSIIYAAAGTIILSLVTGSIFPDIDVMLLDIYLLCTMVAGARVSYYLLDYTYRTAQDENRRVLIYGTGDAAIAALHAVQANPELNMTVVGFLDDETTSQAFHDLPVMQYEALTLTPRPFDEIVFAAASGSDKTLRTLSTRCRLARVPLKQFRIDCTEVGLLSSREPQPGTSISGV